MVRSIGESADGRPAWGIALLAELAEQVRARFLWEHHHMREPRA